MPSLASTCLAGYLSLYIYIWYLRISDYKPLMIYIIFLMIGYENQPYVYEYKNRDLRGHLKVARKLGDHRIDLQFIDVYSQLQPYIIIALYTVYIIFFPRPFHLNFADPGTHNNRRISSVVRLKLPAEELDASSTEKFQRDSWAHFFRRQRRRRVERMVYFQNGAQLRIEHGH